MAGGSAVNLKGLDLLQTSGRHSSEQSALSANQVKSVPVHNDDIDLKGVISALGRKRKFILGMTLGAFLVSVAFVNYVSPKYTAEAKLLLENQDNYYARPDKDSRSSDLKIDAEDVLSQVQLAQSRDLSRAVIKKLNLTSVPEFDPVLEGIPTYMRLLMMLGLVKDPTTISPDDRVLESYSNKVNVFANGKSRVISLEVSSKDPKLAAKISNTIAEQYLEQQTLAKKQTTQGASAWLKDTVEPLRQKVIDAETRVEIFRAKSNLFVGTNNNTIANQQLSELNTQLSTARATQADQQSRAKLIRQSLQTGRIFDFSDVLKDDLVRKLSENRSTLRALLASEERVYLPQHPRLKELNAQIADLEVQIKSAAERTARSLENDARAASARVTGVLAEIENQKKLSTQANEDDVQLKALEREAKSLREQFEGYSTKANEATARDARNPVAADARVVTVALPPSVPSFPKSLPIIILATLGALILSIVSIIAGQLLKSSASELPQIPTHKEPELKIENESLLVKNTNSSSVSPSMGLQNAAVLSQDFTGLPPTESLHEPNKFKTVYNNTQSVLKSEDLVKSELASGLPTIMANGPLSVPTALSSMSASLLEPSTDLQKYPQAETENHSQSGKTQSLKALVQNCRSLSGHNSAVTLLMLGNAPRLGVTTSAINLARELSMHGKTVIVDLNQDNPDLDKLVARSEPDGFSDVFAGQASIVDAIHKDFSSRSHVITFGYSEIDVTDVREFSHLIEILQKTYDYLVIDGGALPNAPVKLSANSNMIVLSVAANDADAQIRSVRDNLTRSGAKNVTVLRCELEKSIIEYGMAEVS